MDKNNILEYANKIFERVDQVNNDVFKAELTFGTDTTAGVYYLDFSQKFDEINFKEYQKDLLSKEYFKNRGNLQWNYYLCILQDNIDREKKYEIESDDQYARKYVFNEKEFIDFFTVEKFENKIEEDLTNKWKRKLDEINFSEVYSRIPMTKAVSKYINGKTKKAKSPNFFEGKEQLTIYGVDHLVLSKDYREFPKEYRDFQFGKANLFYGINGVGKTSLFESIEMILCGRTLRNPDVLEKDGSIKAYYNDSSREYSYVKYKNDIYKSRDLYWYANPRSRGTSLVESFNRFNYFNSDAAYEFSKSDNEESIRNALYNLVLGPEYNHLKERVEKIWGTHIRVEFNRLNKSIKSKRDEIRSAERKLQEIKVSENIRIIENSILEEVDKLQLAIELDSLENDYSILELKLNEIEVLLNSIQIIFGELITKEDIDNKKKIDIKYSEKLDNFENEIRIYNEEKEKIKKRQKSVYDKIKTLESAEKYYLNPSLFSVTGINKRKNRIKYKLSEIVKIKEYIYNTNFDSIHLKNIETKKALKIYIEKESDLKKVHTKLSEKIEVTLSQFGEIDRINKELIQLGKDFLALSKDSTDCPLCLTHLEVGELERRINRTVSSDTKNSSEELAKLYEQKKLNKKETDEIRNQISKIKFILESLSKLGYVGEIIEDNKIIENVYKINNEINNIDNLNKELLEIEWLENKIYEYNVSESELIVLQKEVESLFPGLKFTSSSVNDFKKIKNETLDKLSSLDNKFDELTKNIALTEDQFKREVGLEREEEVDIRELKNEREKVTRKIRNANSLFDDLKREMKIESNKTVNEYFQSIKLLDKKLKQYKDDINNISQIKFWEHQKHSAEEYIESNKDKIHLFRSANNTLKSIKDEMDSNEYLDGFFKSNLKEIFDIFKTIHVPKEFNEIEFVNGEISLTDISGSTRKISEISTGQRSALALSIFLCLNRKLKNGPNIILFDDPVSFIDDFNALSFLDYLRYFIIHEKKQIFFATANIKLAKLFKKKFWFLQDDFKNWEFKRTVLT